MNIKPDTNQFLDINKDFTKFTYEYDELDINDLYYFDTVTYKFVVKRFLNKKQQKEFDQLIGVRYIKTEQFVYESLYVSLIELIDNDEVTEWFLSTDCEEERYIKYRIFLDFNEIYIEERYRLYLMVYPIVIKWCEDNKIRYRFHLISPPKDYIYANPIKLKNAEWEIPKL